MKIKPDHFEHLKNEIEKVLARCPNAVKDYENGNFRNSDKVKDLQTRFNWDCFHSAGLLQYTCDVLYKYLNDDHISTALRKICPKVVRKY